MLETSHLRSIIWVLMSQDEDVYEEAPIPFNVDFLVGRRIGQEMHFNKVFRVYREGALEKVPFGTCSLLSNATVQSTRSLFSSRFDLRGFSMQAYTFYQPLYTLTQKADANGAKGPEGYFGHVWKVLQGRLNFKTMYNVSTVDSTAPSGTTTAIARLSEGKYDVSVAAARVIKKRAELVDFTHAIHSVRYVIAVRTTEQKEPWKAFLRPFDETLWIALLCMLMLIAIVMTLLSYLGRHYLDPDYESPQSLTSTMFDVITMVCKKGVETTPKSYSGRIVFWVGLICCVVVMEPYCASLVSLHTIKSIHMPVSTLRGLAKSKQYRLGYSVHRIGIFNDSDAGIPKRLIKKVESVPSNIVASAEEGILKMCKEKYAFWCPLDLLEAVGDVVPCNYQLIRYDYTRHTAFALRKFSPYRSSINHVLTSMRSTGILQRIRYSTWTKGIKTPTNEWSAITLSDISFLLYIMLCGVSTSLILLFLEHLRHYLTSRYRERQSHFLFYREFGQIERRPVYFHKENGLPIAWK